MALQTRVNDVVTETMKIISKMDQVHYSLLEADAGDMAAFKEELQKIAEESFKVVHNVKTKAGNVSLDEALTHISDDRRKLINTSLTNQTFAMSHEEKGNANKVNITKDGEDFMPYITSSSPEPYALQAASIMIEVVIIMLNGIGKEVPKNPKAIAKAVAIAQRAFTTIPSFANHLNDLATSEENGDLKRMGLAVVHIQTDLYEANFLMPIARALVPDMPWRDWYLSAAKLTACNLTIIGNHDEMAVVGHLHLDSVDWKKKISNLRKFKALAKK